MTRKLWMSLAPLAWLGCGAGLPGDLDADASTALTAPSSGAVVKLVNACSGENLDVSGASGADGAPLLQWPDNGHANQHFKLTAAAAGGYTLTSVGSGKVLDVPSASTANGTQLQQWSGWGGSNQRFLFTADAQGGYRISPVHAPGKIIKIRGASTSAGAAVELNDRSSSCSERWTLALVSGGGAPAPVEPSGTEMPKGDLAGWKQTLAEDFTTSAGAGSAFAKSYASSWCGYTDNAKYRQANLSASGGNMVVSFDGSSGAAGVWAPGGCSTAWAGQTYGRYAFRFKAVNAAGNGTATMIWPVSDIWGDGEIDYPEGNFDGTLSVNHHGTGCGSACGAADSTNTGVTFTAWHVAAVEWSPGKVVYLLDDKVVKTVTHDVPFTNHRFTFQAAPTGNAKPGQFLVDWVVIYSRS